MVLPVDSTYLARSSWMSASGRGRCQWRIEHLIRRTIPSPTVMMAMGAFLHWFLSCLHLSPRCTPVTSRAPICHAVPHETGRRIPSYRLLMSDLAVIGLAVNSCYPDNVPKLGALRVASTHRSRNVVVCNEYGLDLTTY